KDLASARSVTHFRMKLDAKDGTAAMPDRRDGASIRRRQGNELTIHRLHLIAVAHPNDSVFGNAGQELIGFNDMAMCPAEFTAARWSDVAAERLASQVHAVADAEDWDIKVEDFRITARGAGRVYALRSTGKNDSF